ANGLPSVIYAGTGEADNSGDSYYGRGILRSSDGGTTWTLVGNTQFDRKGITKIVIDPANTNIVYVAVANAFVNAVAGGNGIWKTTDGGQTWTNTTTNISTNDNYTDLVMHPTNDQILYMAVGTPGDGVSTTSGSVNNGVYKTTNGGTTWSL